PCSFVHLRPPPTSPLFPYTTLFRSRRPGGRRRRPRPRAALLQEAGGMSALGVYLPGTSPMHRAPAGAKISALVVLVVAMSVLVRDRKSTRLNSSHVSISYAVFCLKK